MKNWEPALSRSHSILTRARRQGISPWTMVRQEGPPDGSIEEKTVYLTAASIAEVMDVVESREERDFSSCFYDPQSSAFMKNLAGSLGVEAACGQWTVGFHLASFELRGRHRYVVSDGLATLLALTELRGLTTDALKLPHKSLYLEIPACLGLNVFNREHGLIPAQGVFIHEDTKDTATTKGAVTPGRSWRLLVASQPYREAYGSDSAQAFFSLPLVDGDTVEQAIERLRLRQAVEHHDTPERSVEMSNWLDVWRWVMNVMVYAATPDVEADHIRGNEDAEAVWRRVQKIPKGSPKRERLSAQLKAMDHQWQTVLGKSVLLTPALREMHEHVRTGGASSGVLRVRTLVSGHWQRYASGEGRKERVWRFRQPYWRGPEDGPVALETEHRL